MFRRDPERCFTSFDPRFTRISTPLRMTRRGVKISNFVLFLRAIRPRPTIMDIICTYKSLTTRMCKKHGFKDKLFQDSFYDHIIRNLEDYRNIAKYIYDNPSRWCYDTLYIEE